MATPETPPRPPPAHSTTLPHPLPNSPVVERPVGTRRPVQRRFNCVVPLIIAPVAYVSVLVAAGLTLWFLYGAGVWVRGRWQGHGARVSCSATRTPRPSKVTHGFPNAPVIPPKIS